MDEYEPVAIGGATQTYRALADGRIRITIDIDPEHRVEVARNYGEVGLPVAIMRLTQASDQKNQLKKLANMYGDAAQELKQSGFFRAPAVWRAIASDDEFLAWLRLQPCAYCKNEPNEHRPTEAAHVRRIANGAGVAKKPEYSAIPLCHDHHALQHAKGEIALGGKEWFDKKRLYYIELWAWNRLKKNLGIESWSTASPEILLNWADKIGMVNFLPRCYRNSANVEA